MKHVLLFLILNVIFLKGYSFDEKDNSRRISSEFESEFKNSSDQQDLYKLREFLFRKDSEFDINSKDLKKSRDSIGTFSGMTFLMDSAKFVKDYNSAIEYLNKNGTRKQHLLNTFLEEDPNFKNDLVSALANFFSSKANQNLTISESLHYSNTYFSELWGQKEVERICVYNLGNITHDRQMAVDKIQNIFSVNNNLNNTKLYISLTYSAIIILLLGCFFYYLLRISTDQTIQKDSEIAKMFLNGNGLQFVALFALIISIVLFGVLGILEGKELAAILSGISGFILGKGISNKDENIKRPINKLKP